MDLNPARARSIADRRDENATLDHVQIFKKIVPVQRKRLQKSMNDLPKNIE